MTTKKTPVKKTATTKRVAAKKTSTPAQRAAANSRAKPLAAKTLSTANKIKAAQPLKKDKPKKIKMVRDSYSMPENDFEKLAELKKKCLAAGVHVKKSELLRVGLMGLIKLSNASLMTAVKQVAAKK
jgi:hypothetical protein